jgi:hypothetical protein
MHKPTHGHAERSEASSTMDAGGCADGFFTAFRMTNKGVHWQRNEASIRRCAARKSSHNLDGFFARLRMTNFFDALLAAWAGIMAVGKNGGDAGDEALPQPRADE